jgi:pimeloyl-ACP methyl ester carboxylesterase
MPNDLPEITSRLNSHSATFYKRTTIVRRILIRGIDNLLGSYLAARCLQTAGDRVFYLPGSAAPLLQEEVIDLVDHAARQIAEGGKHAGERPKLAGRLQSVGSDLKVDAPGGVISEVSEVWYFANSRPDGSHVEALTSLISACPTIGAGEFNYVAFDKGSVELGEEITGQEIAQRCKAENIEFRIFHTSLIAGSGHPRFPQRGAALSQFLSVLHALKAEIEERSPEYFDFQSLRFFAPKDAALNVIPAALASDLLLGIARTNGTTGSSFAIVNPHNTPFSALCEHIAIAYGLGLLAVQDCNKLNAIDRILHERSVDFHGYLIGGATESPSEKAYKVAGVPPDETAFDEDAQIKLFESIRKSQDQALAAVRQRTGLSGRLVDKTIIRDGSKLRYYAGGKMGSTVVLLNALGQGLECWHRLIDHLVENYRVIIWEPRGTIAPPPPFGVTDQVDDLDAIVQQEGIESCHLVGWCTAPKVAIDFHLRRASVVRSMAFLNATFKCKGSPEELDSPYEQNMESLCQMLLRKPSTAASVMKTFQKPSEENEAPVLGGADAEQVSVSVLSRMNPSLKSHVLAPFRTEETILNYSQQLTDFWLHDSRPKACEVRIPVLLIGAEYDQVATPATSKMAAELFPNARHVHVRAATHYLMYDRPQFVAGLLQTFFENPDAMPLVQGRQNEVAQSQ